MDVRTCATLQELRCGTPVMLAFGRDAWVGIALQRVVVEISQENCAFSHGPTKLVVCTSLSLSHAVDQVNFQFGCQSFASHTCTHVWFWSFCVDGTALGF